MLEIMKELLGISIADISKDNILNFYLGKSQLAIKSYCNIDLIPDTLSNVVVDLSIYYYQNKDNQGIASKTQGARSVSYVNNDNGIPESIKTCLPLPKLKVV